MSEKWICPFSGITGTVCVEDGATGGNPIDVQCDYPGVYLDKRHYAALLEVVVAARGVIAADQTRPIWEVSRTVAEAINALDEGREGRD